MEPLISFLLFLFGAYFFYRLGRFVERDFGLTRRADHEQGKTNNTLRHSQN